MSKLWISSGLILFFSFSGCAAPELAKKTTSRTVGGSLSGNSFVSSSPGRVDISGHSFYVPDVVAQIKLPPDSVCANASAVLVDALGLNVVCSASGTFSFSTADNVSGSEVASSLLMALRRSGARVAIEGQSIIISGKDVDGSAGTGTSASGDGVESVPGGWSFIGPSDVAQAVTSAAVTYARGPFSVQSIPGDSSLLDALDEVARYSELPVNLAQGDGRVYLIGPSNAVSSLLSVSRISKTVTVPLTTAGLTETSVAALSSAFPDVVISFDADSGQLYVTGAREDVQDALPVLNRSVRSPSQIRLRAAVIEWSDGTDQTFATSVSGRIGDVRVDFGAGSGSLVFGRDLSASISALRSVGKVSLLVEPTLLVSDGGTAKFVSGDQIPIYTETTETDSGDRLQSIQYRETGVVISAKVNRRLDGAISVIIDWSMTGVRDDTGAGGNPVFTSRQVQSHFTVTSGQTVALGGMSDARDTFSGSSIPGLPFGVLGSRKSKNSRSELIMLITPEVLGAAGSDLFDM